jgi:hypothetical protein
MDNKKFVGFYIIGAANKKDAQKGAGLLLWSQDKPNFITRFFDKVLLNIYWIDKEDYKPVSKEELQNTKTEFPKHNTYRKKKTNETK